MVPDTDGGKRHAKIRSIKKQEVQDARLRLLLGLRGRPTPRKGTGEGNKGRVRGVVGKAGS